MSHDTETLMRAAVDHAGAPLQGSPAPDTGEPYRRHTGLTEAERGMEKMARYRLLQDGLKVAEVEAGEAAALQEILHYAAVYGQDGPVQIERKVEAQWWPVRVEQ